MEKGKVLVCEDDQIQQEYLKMILQDSSYEADYVDSGREALMEADLNDYKLILMDLMLPDFSGIEVIHFLRKTLQISIPIIVVSGSISEELRSRLNLIYGIEDFIQKPFTKQTMQNLLRSYLQI